jgi:hypothetical protein
MVDEARNVKSACFQGWPGRKFASNRFGIFTGLSCARLNKAFLLMDRDTKYTEEFRDYLDREG